MRIGATSDYEIGRTSALNEESTRLYEDRSGVRLPVRVAGAVGTVVRGSMRTEGLPSDYGRSIAAMMSPDSLAL